MKIDKTNLEIRMQMENLLRGSSSAGTILKTDSGDDGEDMSFQQTNIVDLVAIRRTILKELGKISFQL